MSSVSYVSYMYHTRDRRSQHAFFQLKPHCRTMRIYPLYPHCPTYHTCMSKGKRAKRKARPFLLTSLVFAGFLIPKGVGVVVGGLGFPCGIQVLFAVPSALWAILLQGFRITWLPGSSF